MIFLFSVVYYTGFQHLYWRIVSFVIWRFDINIIAASKVTYRREENGRPNRTRCLAVGVSACGGGETIGWTLYTSPWLFRCLIDTPVALILSSCDITHCYLYLYYNSRYHPITPWAVMMISSSWPRTVNAEPNEQVFLNFSWNIMIERLLFGIVDLKWGFSRRHCSGHSGLWTCGQHSTQMTVNNYQ